MTTAKKIISLITIALLIISLTSCANSKKPKVEQTTIEKTSETQSSDKEPIEDQKPEIETETNLSLDFIFENSHKELLDEKSIVGYDKVFLQIGINEIYAKHGYSFKGEHWKKYFENKEWYEVDENFSESNFNDIEKKNISFLKSMDEPIQSTDKPISPDLLSGKFGPVFSAISDKIGGDATEYDGPDTYTGSLVTDIDINDGKINALIFDCGPSADFTVSIYSYNEENACLDFITNNSTTYYQYEIKGDSKIELELLMHGIFGSGLYSLKGNELQLEEENLSLNTYTLAKDVGDIKKGSKVKFVDFEYIDESDGVRGFKISPEDNSKIIESFTYENSNYPGNYSLGVPIQLLTEMFEEITFTYYGD